MPATAYFADAVFLSFLGMVTAILSPVFSTFIFPASTGPGNVTSCSYSLSSSVSGAFVAFVPVVEGLARFQMCASQRVCTPSIRDMVVACHLEKSPRGKHL